MSASTVVNSLSSSRYVDLLYSCRNLGLVSRQLHVTRRDVGRTGDPSQGASGIITLPQLGRRTIQRRMVHLLLLSQNNKYEKWNNNIFVFTLNKHLLQ